MDLIDTHTHTWGENTGELPWNAEVLPPGWKGSYTHRDLVDDMDRVGIDEAVVVTTPLYGWGERANEYTMRSIECHPTRLYGVGIVDFFCHDSDVLESRIRRIVSHDRMLGVRMHPALAREDHVIERDVTPDWMLEDKAGPIWATLADEESCAFLIPKAEQLPILEQLAATHPDVIFVIEHMGWPDETTAPDESPWADFEAIAEHDNVYVKVSSLPRSSEQDWPYSDLHGYVRNLLDWFGPERLMLGSDYPWMDNWATYDDCLSWIDTAEFLSRRDRTYLSYRTFHELHRE